MKRSILAVMVISLGLAGCNTSYNYFEDDTEGAPDPGPFNLAQSLMRHSGVVAKPQQRLAYKPRAPIAMPGTSDLPNPQDNNNAAQAAANFPVDQSVQDADRRSRLAAAFGNDQRNSDPGNDNSGRVTRQGLVRLPAEAVAQRPAPEHEFRDKNPVRSLKEMRKKLNFRSPAQKLLAENGEAAPRKYLIQPPDEFRTPASTAPLPESGDIENSEWLDKQLYRDVKQPKNSFVR